MAKSRFKKKGFDYLKMSPEDFIKFIAHHRGGHAFQLKHMATKYLQYKTDPQFRESHENKNMDHTKDDA